MILPGKSSSVSPAKKIMAEYAEKYSVTIDDLRGPARKRPLVHYRQECMYRIHKSTKFSLSQIGRLFNRDHTTVYHAINAVERRISEGKDCESLYGDDWG